jgi:hypothetical protein
MDVETIWTTPVFCPAAVTDVVFVGTFYKQARFSVFRLLSRVFSSVLGIHAEVVETL